MRPRMTRADNPMLACPKLIHFVRLVDKGGSCRTDSQMPGGNKNLLSARYFAEKHGLGGPE